MKKISLSCETESELNELIQFISSRYKVKQRGNPSKSKDGKFWRVYLDIKNDGGIYG